MTSAHPPWLKRMQNGSIGEARARAFLIDRFWILERSVDIEGADFIIQRRITTSSLFDLNPPRLGLVQAKFFQDEKTDIYIHSEYVMEKTGEPHPEFYLLASTGYEDKCVMYFLSAEDIILNFEKMPPETENAGKYKVSGRALLENKFRVVSPKLTLHRMEAALNLADITKNRSFMYPFVSAGIPNENAIAPMYSDKIDNAYTSDIPKAFFSIKKTARKLLQEVDEAKNYLDEIISSVDPLQALKAAEDFDSMLTTDGRLSLKRLHDVDFEEEVQTHVQKVTRLKAAGLLDSYIFLRECGENLIAEHLCVSDEWNQKHICIFSLTIDTNLNIQKYEFQRIESADTLPNNGRVQTTSSTADTIVLSLSFVPAACRWTFSDSYQENPTWTQTVVSNSRVWMATILFTISSWIDQGFVLTEK